jgi:hypothetical protein
MCSVAEPEPKPVERQFFAGAGAKVFWVGSGSGYANSYKMLQKTLKRNFLMKIFFNHENLRMFS